MVFWQNHNVQHKTWEEAFEGFAKMPKAKIFKCLTSLVSDDLS